MRRAFDLLVADEDEPSDSLEQITTFEDRLQEFWDVVNMSFTSPEDDSVVHTYPSFSIPKPLNRWGFWCPITEKQQELAAWLDYSNPVREAIRRGFRRGIGKLTDYYGLPTLENWLEFKSGLLQTMPIHLELIKGEAKRTKQYALAQARIELLLNDIYKEGKHVAYHPDFDRAMTAKLAQLPLHRISDFLLGVCQRNELNNPIGYDYLTDLITEVAEDAWLNSPAKVDRARTCLETMRKSITNSPIFDYAVVPLLNTTPTVASLCCAPFAPADFNELLVRLGVLKRMQTTSGVEYCLNGSLEGKGRVKISKAYAALVELGANGLMDLSKNNWRDVLLVEPYRISFGPKVQGYGYKQPKGSAAYDDGTEKTRKWLKEWLSR
jgi:hypothetical protein